MTITLRQTKGFALTWPELDGNFTHLQNSVPISVKNYGAVGDGVTDDTAALQAAVDSIGSTANTRRSGMNLIIPCPIAISSTILIEQKSFTLSGNGWGRLDDTNGLASYIRWIGAAGTAMFKIKNCAGGMRIQNLAFKGNTTAKPSAAIELNQTAGIINSSNFFENIRIGSDGSGDDNGEQFTDGIVSTGLNANNAEQFFSRIKITGCSGIGIKQSFQQNGNWNLNDIDVNDCAVGVQLASSARGSMWVFTLNDVDIKYVQLDDLGNTCTPRCSIHRYFSEQSGRMLAVEATGEFSVLEGDFAISASLNADGKIVSQTQGNQPFAFTLRDFIFQQISGPPASPYLSFLSSPGGGDPRQIILDGIRGWPLLTGGVNGLDITTQTNVDGAFVYLRQINTAQTGFKARFTRQDLQGAASRNLDITKYALPYSAPSVRLYDDFLGDVLADEWNGRVGTDPQCVTAAISAAVGGMVRMVTGDDAAADMATNGVQLESALNWQGNAGGLTCEFRVKMSAITAVAYFFGLTDQAAALEMPFTHAAGDVLTSNATDAVGVLFDTAADTDNWWMVGVANNVDATKQNSAVAPVADTYEKWRIEVGSTGEAKFFRNGVAIGSTMSGAVRTTIPLTPVIAAFSRGAASRNIDADKIYVEQDE